MWYKQVLEEALKLVGEQYESELCGVIRTMLRRNFKQRPTALELKQMQYVNHCIALSKSKPGDAGVYNGVEGKSRVVFSSFCGRLRPKNRAQILSSV